MKLIIVRHGETKENINSIMQGHKYGTLSENGKKQVQRVAERLKDEGIDKIFSSDLERTRDTVKEIAKHHDIDVDFREVLRERKAGRWAGEPVQEMRNDRKEKGLEKHVYRPENGENYLDVRERTSKFLDEIVGKYKDETVLLVSHGTAIKIMLSYLLGEDIKETRRFNQHNTAVNIFEFDGREVEDYLLNDTRHLENS